MGSTIRREPVVFDIPDAPDYKFLNITNFGGLSVTDNPLQADYRTASDCKNIYVDETDALSTRPRLQIKYKSSDLFSESSYEILNFYSLSDGYLVHYKVGNIYKLLKINENGQINTISGNIPQKDINFIYEKDGIIYISLGDTFYTIKDNTISILSEPYIPTTKIGSTTNTGDTIQISYEGLNLLSNKFKETLFWDGSDEIKLNSNVVEVTNNYYKSADFQEDLVNIRILNYYSDDTFLGIDCENNTMVYGYFSGDNLVIHDLEIDVDFVLDDYKASIYNKNFAVLHKQSNSVSFYTLNTDNLVVTRNGYYADTSVSTFVCRGWSNDAKALFYTIGSINDTGTGYVMGLLTNGETVPNASSGVKRQTVGYTNSDNCIQRKMIADKVDSNIAIYGEEILSPSITRTIKRVFFGKWGTENTITLNNNASSNGTEFNILKFANTKYLFFGYKDDVYYTLNVINLDNTDLSSSDIDYQIYNFPENIQDLGYNTDNTIGYFLTYINDSDISEGYYLYLINDVTDLNKYFNTYIKIKPSTGITDLLMKRNDYIIYPSFVDSITPNTTFLVFNNTSEPQIEVLYRISEDNTDWSEKRAKFLQSHLVTRFENNWWFASGNRVYHTENNDPTYISEFGYSDVGDSKEDITGFNIVDNSTLIIYKKNSIYSIQSATVEDINTYILLESKNTVGNNAIGAPIITTLTELPIHISYNGIFALNQLPDVQSSDRIATLISTGINPKWLKEDKTIIDNAITFNYLYWTYIVLKYTDLTKVYVIDNRTSNWFYWELPINCLTAYCKDNKIEFVDTDGNVMTMETEDIYTNENDTNNISYTSSAYYDLDKQIIDWYWRSQILYLGTINYSKRLVNTTFIVADTDTSDEYSLDYKFKSFRKVVSETDATTLSDTLNYVQSVTKKTVIPRFKFLQIEVANTPDDLYNNKLRLIGLSLKYVLLESML